MAEQMSGQENAARNVLELAAYAGLIVIGGMVAIELLA
jgi:hypothetical protein